jgi:hypothetical protein
MDGEQDAAGSRLGIDIGRVIIAGSSGQGSDTSFFEGGVENALRTPAVAGSFRVIRALVDRFDGRVWLVSKCGPRVEDRTRQWLAHHDLYGRTGLDPAHVRFCRARPDKAIHCAELGITHFIDDRSDVLRALDGVVARRFLFGPQRRPAPRGVEPVATWADVEARLLGDGP